MMLKYLVPLAIVLLCLPANCAAGGYEPPKKECHKETYECGKDKYKVHVAKTCTYDCGYDEWKEKPKYCEKHVCKEYPKKHY
jgi:hypothetical protein